MAESSSSTTHESKNFTLNSRLVSYFSQEGTGHDIEDRFVIKDLGNGVSFFGIFDGHGGVAAANFFSQSIPNYITKTDAYKDKTDYSQAVWDGFLEADNDFLAKKEGSGCCGIVGLLIANDPANVRILVGNVGDSRAILIKSTGDAIPLSNDHKASNESEKERIKKQGGFVSSGRLYGILAVSRAFGDKDLKSEHRILIAEPEITETKITDEDSYLLIACDGLWDVFENQEVADFVNQKINAQDVDAVTKDLVKEAVKRGSRDDITIIIVHLKSSTTSSSHVNQSEEAVNN